MMWIYEFCKWLQHTSVGVNVSESLWLFPLIETIHIWGIILLVGTTGVLDLRLLGLILTSESRVRAAPPADQVDLDRLRRHVHHRLFMFASEATKMYENSAFRLKMLLIVLAGFNALVFELFTFRRVDTWDSSPQNSRTRTVCGVRVPSRLGRRDRRRPLDRLLVTARLFETEAPADAARHIHESLGKQRSPPVAPIHFSTCIDTPVEILLYARSKSRFWVGSTH